MPTSDLVDVTRSQLKARMRELAPLVDEYERLQAAAAALAGTPPGAPSSPQRRRSRSRPARREDDGATRSAQALALVQASPGITVPEIAQQIGIRQNYLYRVLSALAGDGLVVKDGRGWRPAAA